MALLGKPLGWRLTHWPNRRDLWMVSQLRTESYQNDSQSSILTNKLPTFCDDRLPKINDKLPSLRILHDDRLPTKTNPSPCALPSATLLCSCSNSELPGLALTWCLVAFWAFNFRIPATCLFYYFQTSSMNSNGSAHGPIWMYRAYSELGTVETSKNLWIQGEKHPCSEDRKTKKNSEWLENVFCHVDPLTGNNPIPRTSTSWFYGPKYVAFWGRLLFPICKGMIDIEQNSLGILDW